MKFIAEKHKIMKGKTLSLLKSNTIKSFAILLLISLITLPGCKEEEFYHTVSVTVNGPGVVSPMQGRYVAGSTVNLTATPDVDNGFLGWTGDTRSTDNPLLLVIRSDFKINANFEGDDDKDGVLDSQDICSDTPDDVVVMENGCPVAAIYLDENGVTVKTDSSTKPGSMGELDGIIYTVVNREMLDNMYGNGESISNVVTTLITDMSDMFGRSFNQDISAWDVSNVTDMSGMFGGAYTFNQDLSSWDVSNVTDMSGMFSNSAFDQDISNWDVSNVKNMSFMFGCEGYWGCWQRSFFNQDISSWDVSNVTDMGGMFSNSASFNQDIGDWNVSNVANMRKMFSGASSFNQDISSWNVSNVTTTTPIRGGDLGMSEMFFGASLFNQDISSWDISNITDMSGMFYNATSFNQDLSTWDVNHVTMCIGFSTDATSWTLPKPNFTDCDPDG